MAWLTPQSKGDTVYRLLSIPSGFLSQVNGALIDLEEEWNWEEYGALTPAQCAQYMSDMLEAYWGVNPLIGTVHDYFTASLPDGVLLCDGTQYARADYPDLYARIAPAYIIDADNFITPPLVGMVTMGDVESIGATVGSEEITLDVTQIPVHNHEDTGHTHTEITALPNVTTIGLEVPEPTALPSAGLTGVGFANISNTGGGLPHSNIQPSAKAMKGIIAR